MIYLDSYQNTRNFTKADQNVHIRFNVLYKRNTHQTHILRSKFFEKNHKTYILRGNRNACPIKCVSKGYLLYSAAATILDENYHEMVKIKALGSRLDSFFSTSQLWSGRQISYLLCAFISSQKQQHQPHRAKRKSSHRVVNFCKLQQPLVSAGALNSSKASFKEKKMRWVCSSVVSLICSNIWTLSRSQRIRKMFINVNIITNKCREKKRKLLQ